MTAAPKLERCPMCGTECGVRDVFRDPHHQEWLIGHRVECDDFCSCGYVGAWCETPAEAIAAHNQVALAVRLFPRACELLRGVDDRGRYPEESLEAWGRSVAYDEWTDQRDALLTEAQGVADAE